MPATLVSSEQGRHAHCASDRGRYVRAVYEALWPFQELSVAAEVDTPRRVSLLERTVLRVFFAMGDHPPSSQEISDALCIYPQALVEQAIQGLAALGALAPSNGSWRAEEKGLDALRLGRIGAGTCRVRFSLFFDVIAADFPGDSLRLDDSQWAEADDRKRWVIPAPAPADPARVDLDTVRRVSASQGYPYHQGDSRIVSARVSHPAAESAPDPDRPVFRCREVRIEEYRRNGEEPRFQVRERDSSKPVRWYGAALERLAVEGALSLSHLPAI